MNAYCPDCACALCTCHVCEPYHRTHPRCFVCEQKREAARESAVEEAKAFLADPSSLSSASHGALLTLLGRLVEGR